MKMANYVLLQGLRNMTLAILIIVWCSSIALTGDGMKVLLLLL